VATGGKDQGSLARNIPRRLAALVPKCKASDYDYIIFDLPPVSQTSFAQRLGAFMDIVLFVAESEKTHIQAAKEAVSMLKESKARVGAVLNKRRSYIPGWLHQEL
jgi:Mrp family chromosome partitioning ATPase